jgi:MFS family permease
MLGWQGGGLWRSPDFLKFWSAQTISQFGSQVSQLAIPLIAIIVFDATTIEVAALATIEFLPFVLFTLPAGVWVDRLPRRPILVASDLGRAALLATIPITYIVDALTMWQLYVVSFAVGICTVFFDVAYQSFLPSLVDRTQIVEGNAKLEISRSTAQIGGPGLGGALVQLFTAPYAILIDALSFAASGVVLLRIRNREPHQVAREAAAGPGMWAELREGLAYVLGSPYLRPIAGSSALINLFGSVGLSIYLVYVVRDLGLSPVVIGIVLSMGNVGALMAAMTANRLNAKLPLGRTLVGSLLIVGLASFLVPLAPQSSPVPFLVASLVVAGFAGVIYNVAQVSFRQAITPERLQGRMNSVMRFIVWGTIPPGMISGGVLGAWIGVRETLFIMSIGLSLAFIPALLSPVRKLREIPAPEDAALSTQRP